MAAIAELIRQPFYLWHTLCLRVVRAILDGRYADAEELAATALELGRLRQSDYPTYVFQYAQLFAIRWAQGGCASSGRRSAAHGDLFPWIPRWRDALAAAELGDRRAARAEVERYARNDFADLPRDGLWLLHLCALAEACVLIGDERARAACSTSCCCRMPTATRSATPSSRSAPWPCASACSRRCSGDVGGGGAPLRDGARALRGCSARAASCRASSTSTLACCVRAAVPATAAAAANARRGRGAGERARPSRVCSNASSPCAQAPPSVAAPARLPAGGRVWTIDYAGHDVQAAGRQGSPLHRLPSRARPAARSTRSSSRRRSKACREQAPRRWSARARHSTRRRRTRTAGGWKSSARSSRRRVRWDDPERAARTRGGDRRADRASWRKRSAWAGATAPVASPAERARVSVTKAIRSAIKTIERHSPALGEHLAAVRSAPASSARTRRPARCRLAGASDARVGVGGTTVPRGRYARRVPIANEERNA